MILHRSYSEEVFNEQESIFLSRFIMNPRKFGNSLRRVLWRPALQSLRMLCSLGVWIVAFIVLMHEPGRSYGNSERKALSFHLRAYTNTSLISEAGTAQSMLLMWQPVL